MSKLTDKLKSFRKKHELTADEMAWILGLKRSSYYQWENGTRRPDEEYKKAKARIELICEVMKCRKNSIL